MGPQPEDAAWIRPGEAGRVLEGQRCLADTAEAVHDDGGRRWFASAQRMWRPKEAIELPHLSRPPDEAREPGWRVAVPTGDVRPRGPEDAALLAREPHDPLSEGLPGRHVVERRRDRDEHVPKRCGQDVVEGRLR